MKKLLDDFCFQLTDAEVKNLRSQNVISSLEETRMENHGGVRYLPYGFTREGANMLSTVLKTKTAAARAVQIMRAFTKLEEAVQAGRIPSEAMFGMVAGVPELQAEGENMNQVTVSQIEINVNGKTVKLSLEEAMELKRILNDTFPEKTIQFPITIPQPIYIPYETPYRWRYWDGTYITTSGTLCLTSNQVNG